MTAVATMLEGSEERPGFWQLPRFATLTMGFMTSDDEKDPPVPADLVGAPKRIHRDQTADEHEAPAEEEAKN